MQEECYWKGRLEKASREVWKGRGGGSSGLATFMTNILGGIEASEL